MQKIQSFFSISGPAFFFAIGLQWIAIPFLTPSQQIVVALSYWMVSWWILSVLPAGIIALLPLITLPVLKIVGIQELAASYGNSVIFLFLGGFILAQGLQTTHLDERLALQFLRFFSKSLTGVLVGFTAVTAFLSMWMSNTATAVMMLPIGVSLVKFLSDKTQTKGFSTALFLTIAFAANIGGIMTPIGTPPNMVLLGYLSEIYNQNIRFEVWMLVACPIGLVMLALQVGLLKRIFPFDNSLPKEVPGFLQQQLSRYGKFNSSEIVMMSVFGFTCLLWIFKTLINQGLGDQYLNDTSIALGAGFLLFAFPFKSPVLRQSDIQKLPWDIVLLFGGGMALAHSMETVGLLEMLLKQFESVAWPSIWWVMAVSTVAGLLLTEVLSNVAICVVMLPVLMKIGEGLGISPLLLAVPFTLATSFAFSLPIATPPNAIVLSSGHITVRQMLKAGVWMNLFGCFILTTLGWWLMSYFSSSLVAVP